MEFFKKKTSIRFMGRRRIAMVFSVVLIVGSLVSLFVKGLNFGIDFTGGTVIEVKYPQPVDLGHVRDALAAKYGDAQAQYFGTARDV
ncbi:MAG TPA: protein translocase subunit SecF, partial [Gammaproteobacteria bacterium]|nr:protein translocase subunit SecF [Gammaproteobacteria bacterium]